MKLKDIEINNFHCYQKETFSFAKKVTILIGKNGSGKTSLLKALKNALSVFFTYSNKSWNCDSIVGNVPDLKIANMKPQEIWHDNNMKPASEVRLAVTTTESHLNWSLIKTSTAESRVQSKYYKDAFIHFRNVYNDSEAWPLFIYYSDSFPHISANFSDTIKSTLRNDINLYRGWAYYHWDKDDSCAFIWLKRYMRIYDLRFKRMKWLDMMENKESDEAKKCIEEISQYSEEINFVLSRFSSFANAEIPNISNSSDELRITDIIVDGDEDESYLVAYFTDGSRRRWDELPAGYERLYNIVFDIAYRSYVLNKNHEPFGIVMIDEIDLHLHPSMEQDVLQRLTATFPNLQFIISTHSPLVIGNTPFGNDGKVLLLRNEGEYYSHIEIADPFGLDYNIILSAIMETEPRNVKLQLLKDKYIRLKRRNKTELAEETLSAIKTLVQNIAIYDKIVEELNQK